MRLGARDFIEKPWDNARLLTTLRTQVELGRALRAAPASGAGEPAAPPRAGLPDLVAESPAMRPVLELMERVAPSDANVLVTGEHGTGKEVVARWIHAASRPRGRARWSVNVGGLSEGVFESELFGHVRGRLHRRQDRSRRALRARRWRHPVPRRDRQHRARAAVRCFGSCRPASSNGWAPPRPGGWTSASSPPPMPT